jgi:hypothetical protein
MKERYPKCPLCNIEFHYKHVDLELPFRCPACDQWLRVAHGYWYVSSGVLAALVIAGIVCFGFGARGATLVFYAVFACAPILFVVVFWKMHFAPPHLEPSSPPSTDVLGLNRQ